MSQLKAKQAVKQTFSLLAPKAAQTWQEVRRRRHIRHFEQRMGLPELIKKYTAEHGLTVLTGPFAGMAYVPQATGSALIPKLLGSYEAELHGVIEQIAETNYAVIVDVGCAEGYYANGLAGRLNSSHVYAFDTDPEARTLCREMARLNHVEQRVTVLGECKPSCLNGLLTYRSLIVCDCEGYETHLLQPALVPAMLQSDILVELHDQVQPGLTPLILQRFADTHHAALVTAAKRDAEVYPELCFLEPEKRQTAISEFRYECQQWAFLQAKS